MKILLIDDVRQPELIAIDWGVKVTHVARNFQEGLTALKTNGPFDLLCLDHDLASWDDKGRELTGYDIMLFLEANPEYLPKDILFVSANPVGVKNMMACYDSIKGRK